MIKLYKSTYTAPFGVLTIISDDNDVIYALSFDGDNYIDYFNKSFGRGNYSLEDNQLRPEFKITLDNYFAGAIDAFDNIKTKIFGTDFQNKAWEALKTIPYGKTISYQEQAKIAGNIKAVRAIGGANNKNPIAIIIPCHRVIGKNGAMVGFGGGIAIKEYLLNLEAG